MPDTYSRQGDQERFSTLLASIESFPTFESCNMTLKRSFIEIASAILPSTWSFKRGRPVAGNSYVESPSGKPEEDEFLEVSHFKRSRQQQMDLGLLAADEDASSQQASFVDKQPFQHQAHTSSVGEEACLLGRNLNYLASPTVSKDPRMAPSCR